MNILGQSRDYADFRKILSENYEDITSSLYDNNPSLSLSSTSSSLLLLIYLLMKFHK